MSTKLRNHGKSMVTWVLLAMLVLGLGGFGVSNFSGGIQSIGAVGETEISVNDYARALRAEMSPHAFNCGLNLGSIAGAGIPEHLHWHVVPRWGGDANFITIVGGAKVIPQLLRETRVLLATEWAKQSGPAGVDR